MALRKHRLALGVAALTAAALGTVGVTAAQATTTTPAHTRPGAPKGAAFGVSYRPTAQAPGDVNTASDAFGACMADQGVTTYPAFHATKDAKGRVLLRVQTRAGAHDPSSAPYKKALKKCAPILSKAGLTFTDGRPGRPEKGLRTSTGTDEGPGLTTSEA
ncbi:hypothetical protein ACGFZS_30590 [Streptomyces sp. NPDC048288]|uniref:hypothetical protein n=1 Tax=Streptomyces sp. NPDC048288 TaxID=3365529 RepID=UPI0037217EDC